MEKVSYALGMSIANNLMASGIKNLNTEEFVKAIKASLAGEQPAMSVVEAQQVLNDYFTKLQEEQTAAVKAEGEAFLAENAKKEGVVTLPSGLQYKVLNAGTGATPKASDSVECHYEGRLIDGSVFDSSYQRGETATFGVTQVIAGWVEALQLMKEGDKWQLYIPYNLAYGERGAGAQIPPYATLIFDVELVKVK
ncbi:MAG: FKBP-type peptidyl-prolyl cis-trans isomerase [Bacteroidales bacterium]|nr:FKBP-type peptidyl-prolyl cis-trans isomerase [Bacteroidales bacterium]MBQ2913183.1 FKBP-type peptidyl-prolyl cis-trans isomerase [Bacteroidales bacterium]MBQ7019231.1 FKBP-type peptidyl-prolyl cis-trans isomerase [Bacteroidales bacterium]MBR2477747.1 FKBP-type peptidyl-prolyl cis-trans isomerase [Bacteroidales bacterium]